MVFFIDEARFRPPLALLTNVNKKMFFFIEGFPNQQFLIIILTDVDNSRLTLCLSPEENFKLL